MTHEKRNSAERTTRRDFGVLKQVAPIHALLGLALIHLRGADVATMGGFETRSQVEFKCVAMMSSSGIAV